MKNTMTIIKGSSINADNIGIRVSNGDVILFERTYYYGYDVSWDKGFASKDKPFRDDLINDKAKEYHIDTEDIQYENGRNIFKETR